MLSSNFSPKPLLYRSEKRVRAEALRLGTAHGRATVPAPAPKDRNFSESATAAAGDPLTWVLLVKGDSGDVLSGRLQHGRLLMHSVCHSKVNSSRDRSIFANRGVTHELRLWLTGRK